jgi:LacI family transcriptional regulator
VTNIHDVAKRAGVSATTAKRAINEPQLLTKATLERVLKAVQDLNYEPDRTAGALRRGHSQTIGLMVGNIIEPFFAQLTRTIAKAVHASGYALIVADNEYDSDLELENLRMFHGHRVGGLIVRSAFGSGNLEYLKRLHEQGTYILEIDHFLAGSPFGHVMMKNAECVEMGVRYLHDLGHKRIAALTIFDAEKLQDERGKTFPIVMKSLGLRVPKSYQRGVTLSEEGAYSLTLELMQLAEPPTAIFSMTGNEAAGAFRAIKELKLRIPEDVSFLTFDDYSWTSLVDPPLDVITQPIEHMGLAAVEIVLDAIQSRNLKKVVRRRFPGELIRRGSCAAPKKSRR